VAAESRLWQLEQALRRAAWASFLFSTPPAKEPMMMQVMMLTISMIRTAKTMTKTKREGVLLEGRRRGRCLAGGGLVLVMGMQGGVTRGVGESNSSSSNDNNNSNNSNHHHHHSSSNSNSNSNSSNINNQSNINIRQKLVMKMAAAVVTGGRLIKTRNSCRLFSLP
jgi:hypothetical protein